MRRSPILWIAGGMAAIAVAMLFLDRGQFDGSVIGPGLVGMIAVLAFLLFGGSSLMKRWRLSWVAVWLALLGALVLGYRYVPGLEDWWEARHPPPRLEREREVAPVDERWSVVPAPLLAHRSSA